MFVDWYDGEVSAAVVGARLPAPLATRERGDGACPLCRSPMVAAHYPDEDGARVARCGQCAGTFVPRAALDAIVALGAPDAERGGAGEPAWLDAALARVRAFLDW